MKKRKTRIVFAVAILFLSLGLCACANQSTQDAEGNREVENKSENQQGQDESENQQGQDESENQQEQDESEAGTRQNESKNRGEQSGIAWMENEDGSYTFTNNGGTENSVYAWYVLDEDGEIVYKTKYLESPDFVYDLEDNYSLTIKGFVRTGTEEEYEQVSTKVSALSILGAKEYQVLSIPIAEDVITLLRKRLVESDVGTLPVEAVLRGDGSEWEVDLTIPVDWSCPDITNRSFGFRTNGLTFLDGVYRAYCDTRDEKYANEIKNYIVDWAGQNTEYDDANEWIWHDDATALRVMRMSLYYYELKELCSEEEQKLIEDSLRYQAELLTTDEFYTENHNHGMHQDIALLMYALLLGEDRTKESYISTAIKRIGGYLDYVYTEDGIHKEHSPFYARDVLADMMFLQTIAENISPDFSKHVGQYVDGAQEYMLQLIRPDGTWPSVGDSSKCNGIESAGEVLGNNEGYLWMTSGEDEGVMPESEVVFPQGGYAIFRSSWADEADKATWMMFVASTFSSTHKHGDDLEVLLYHKGDLFVEAGNRNYNYMDEMTAWSYSGYAHNVLVVNGEAYPAKIGGNGFQSIYPEALETGITAYDLGENIVSVTGKQRRFDNVEQERTLAYDKENNKVTISDVLEASEDFEGTLLYHIAEGVEVEEISGGWNLYRNGELVAVVSVNGDVDLEIDTVIGESGEYPYHTWIFEGNEDPAYGSLLKINIFGKLGSNKIETIVDLK